MLAWLQAHGSALIVPAFTIASIILTAAESVLVALGKTSPAWMATGLSWIASIIHFLNGNAPAPAVVVSPQPAISGTPPAAS